MKVLAGVVLLFGGWIAWDMADPRTHDLRDFDGHQVARLETAMWRSYYDHRPVRLFLELTELLRTQYGFPFWRSVAGGFLAARAAEVFQAGHERKDYEHALPDLVNYYALIRRTTTPPFDVDRAANLELEWWIIHRERARHTREELDRSLADLQAAIFGQQAARFQEHASARAEAMLLRDRYAQTVPPSAQDWRKIQDLLDASWVSLQEAVRPYQYHGLAFFSRPLRYNCYCLIRERTDVGGFKRWLKRLCARLLGLDLGPYTGT